MNAQYRITTTPTYNFSQVLQKVIELSENILRTHKLQPLQTNVVQPRLITVKDPTKLKPNYSKIQTVAIDVSSIKLGETQTGFVLAIRGAVVWKQNNQYRYLRLGPFPFHITENSTNPTYFQPEPFYVQSKLTTVLERWIQKSINQTAKNSIILWDGSLTASIQDPPIRILEQTLHEARENQNSILAFSKMTRLLLYNRHITDFVWKHSFPCLLRIPVNPIRASHLHLLGNIFAVKLTKGGYAFRLDADKKQHYSDVVEAVQKLIGNDLIIQGYPETLRLAHIYSTFTAAEVLGLQRCVAEKSHMKITIKPNLRRILFGRFGKGLEGR